MSKPLVSILIPVYNAGEYLRPSVQSILSQTYSNIDVHIIDDGSTDGCMDSIADIVDSRVHITVQKNSGKPTALNRAMEQMSGTFYAIHDADDISHPRRIEQQVAGMLENPEAAAVFCGNDIIVDGRRMAPRFAAKGIEECQRDIEHFRMPAHDPTGMFRVSMVDGILYEPDLGAVEGLDYILRLGERHPMIVVGETLYSYRIHFCSVTRYDPLRIKLLVRKVMERACQRRGIDPDEYLGPMSATTCRFLYREQEAGIIQHFMESVLDLRRAGRIRQALRTALCCLRLHPCDPYYYKPLAYSLIPMALIRYYRRLKAGTKRRHDIVSGHELCRDN